MQPAMPVVARVDRPAHWPRYPLQRSPRDFDAVLREVSA
jgi:hypothetical protein